MLPAACVFAGSSSGSTLLSASTGCVPLGGGNPPPGPSMASALMFSEHELLSPAPAAWRRQTPHRPHRAGTCHLHFKTVSNRFSYKREQISRAETCSLFRSVNHDDASGGSGGRQACSKGESTQACEGDDAGRSLLPLCLLCLLSRLSHTTQTQECGTQMWKTTGEIAALAFAED